MTNVKVKMSSSSLLSLMRKSGAPPEDVSGSYLRMSCRSSWQNLGHRQPTCTNSTSALSPMGLEAASLVAGKAFGTMFKEDRLRGFVTTREDIVTADVLAGASESHHRASWCARRTATRVLEIKAGPVVGPAADVPHGWMNRQGTARAATAAATESFDTAGGSRVKRFVRIAVEEPDGAARTSVV